MSTTNYRDDLGGLDLETLCLEARRNGWVSGHADRSDIEYAALPAGWKRVSTRRGDPEVTELRPLHTTEAKPRSLSAIHGYGAQPLHTDGAHLKTPPDMVILHSSRSSATPTRLLRYPAGILGSEGIFLVSNGQDRFLATAFAHGPGAGLRYDQGCMAPQDQRAREIVKRISTAETRAEQFIWAEPNTFLVIDNIRVLHGRAAVTEGDSDRALTRFTFHTKVTHE